MKVESVPVEANPPRNFFLSLSQEEANFLRAILGNIAGRTDSNAVSQFSHELYSQLVTAGARMVKCPFSNDPKWAPGG